MCVGRTCIWPYALLCGHTHSGSRSLLTALGGLLSLIQSFVPQHIQNFFLTVNALGGRESLSPLCIGGIVLVVQRGSEPQTGIPCWFKTFQALCALGGGVLPRLGLLTYLTLSLCIVAMGAGALYSTTVPGKSAPPAAWEGDTLYPLIAILEGQGKGLYSGCPATEGYATPQLLFHVGLVA